MWQVLISKYTPTFLISCKNAIDWSKALADKWITGNPAISISDASNIIKLFAEHSESKSHDRHISKDTCKKVGLIIEDMEEDDYLQDLILSLHHCYMIFFDKTIVVKTVENQIGGSYLRMYNETPSE